MNLEDRLNEDEAIAPEDRKKYLDVGEYASEDELAQSDIVDQLPELDVTDEMLREDVDRADSWLQYNKGLEQTGFSPASGLTPDNLDSLTGEYTVELATEGLETTPIVVPSDPPVMYFTEGNLTTHAVNARTGEEYWAFKPQADTNNAYRAGGGANRGVSVWKDKVYLALQTAEVIALDRYTGEQQWRETTLTEGQQNMVEPENVAITEAPVAFDGMIFVGQAGDSGGWTVMSGMDAETGEMRWQQRTAPESEWVGETWKFSSTAPWMSPAVDPDSETVFWTIANPDPMMNSMVRPGPNRNANSVAALDAKSGDTKWVTQIRAMDMWDYDMFTTPTVFDATIDGEQRRLVSAQGKAGWVHALDVETGQILERSLPYAKQDHEWSEYFPALTPRGEENKANMWPSVTGATEWPPDTYSPETGLRYIGTNNVPNSVYYDPDWEYDPSSLGIEIGGGYGAPEDVEASALVTALDPVSGEIAWKHELQDVDPSWAFARLFTGGTTATAGNIVFHASSGGHLVALDAKTGDLLGRANVADGSQITSSPIVWEDPAEGKQYVSIAANDSIVTYSAEVSQ